MGIVYCLHHAEEDLYGADHVPCPLCGFGESLNPMRTLDLLGARGADDSIDALLAALDETGEDPALRTPARPSPW